MIVRLLVTTWLAGLVGTAAVAGCDTKGTEGDSAADTTSTKAPLDTPTLDGVDDPRELGCAIAPTAAFKHYFSGNEGMLTNCSDHNWQLALDGVRSPLPEIIAATKGTPLPADCRATGWAALPRGVGDVPCGYHYEAIIGTVTPEHQVVEYKIRVEQVDDGLAVGCWTESCDITFRFNYKDDEIVLH